MPNYFLYAFQTICRFTEKNGPWNSRPVKLKIEFYEIAVEKKRLNTLKFMFILKWEYPAFGYNASEAG